MHVNSIAINNYYHFKGHWENKDYIKWQQDSLNQSCKRLQVEWFLLFSLKIKIHFYVKLARTKLQNSAIWVSEIVIEKKAYL